MPGSLNLIISKEAKETISPVIEIIGNSQLLNLLEQFPQIIFIIGQSSCMMRIFGLTIPERLKFPE